jgi:hypothetical protein
LARSGRGTGRAQRPGSAGADGPTGPVGRPGASTTDESTVDARTRAPMAPGGAAARAAGPSRGRPPPTTRGRRRRAATLLSRPSRMRTIRSAIRVARVVADHKQRPRRCRTPRRRAGRDLVGRVGSSSPGRFVGQDERRRMGDRGADGDPLGLAAGQGGGRRPASAPSPSRSSSSPPGGGPPGRRCRPGAAAAPRCRARSAPGAAAAVVLIHESDVDGPESGPGASPAPARSTPQTPTVPALGAGSPMSTRIRVVLPEPLGRARPPAHRLPRPGSPARSWRVPARRR